MVGIVTLTEVNAGELLTLQRAAYVTEAQAHADPWLPPLIESIDEIRSALRGASTTVLGLRDGSRLIASVRMRHRPNGQGVELGRFAVAPDRQGEGLGTRLLAAAEEVLPVGVATVHLFTGERSPANLRLYARQGYEETGREQTSAGYAVVHLVKRIR